MRFDMKLNESPFAMIANGNKTVEIRLNDEKRRQISIGDQIFFHSLINEYDIIICEVVDLCVYDSFEELYQHYSKQEMGYQTDETADPADMYEYYDKEELRKYGALAIRIKKLDRPYLLDGHMHLEYGPLSVEYVMDFVREAIDKGLDEIDILDHSHRFIEFKDCYDHLRKYEQQDVWLDQKTKFCNTLDDYYRLIEEVRTMDLPIRVKFGLEVCYTSNTEGLLKEILKDVKLDFITGAIHSIDSILYDMSFSKELLWDRKEAGEIYRRYYEEVLSLIGSSLFDRLAHPDQIKLFDIDPGYDLKETYEKIADAIAEKGMYAENNTGIKYRYHHADLGIADEMLRIFKEKKVKMITASDAHKPSDVGTLIYEVALRNREGN